MAGNRILFALWLLLWLAAWALGAGNVSGGILLGSLLLAAGELVLTRRIRRRLSAALTAGLSCGKGQPLPVTLTVTNAGFFTAPQVRAVVRCRDLLTGEQWEKALRLAVPGRGEGCADTVFTLPHCGKLELTVQTLAVFDLLGLWAARQPVSLAASALVLPELWPVTLSLSEQCVPDADSAEYSMTRPGDDPSEPFGLREYQAGDRLRSIHWKLSEKTDALMVRQLGLPVDDTLLLVLDNSAAAPPSPAEREALGEAVVSVSAALCQQDVAHRIAWLDRPGGELAFRAVSSMEELTEALPDILSAETEAEAEEVPARLLSCRAADAARMLVLTLRPAGEPSTAMVFCTVTPSALRGKEGLTVAL